MLVERKAASSFKKVKEMLTVPNPLIRFDDNIPLVLASDISPRAVGTVLSHVMDNQTKQLVAYASHSLYTTECNYSH